MANNGLKESMKSLWINHMDPEKDEQQKWLKIEIDTKVRRILKLIKSVNQGNKEANQKKKSELIQLVEDFHNQYQSLYVLYDDLKEGIRNKINGPDEKSMSSSSSSSSSPASEDSYFSPGDLSSQNSETPRADPLINQKVMINNSESEGSYLDEANEVVKEALNVEHVSSSSSMVHDHMTEKLVEECSFLKERLGEKEKEVLSLTTSNQVLEKEASVKIKELEERTDLLKVELEKLRLREVEFENENLGLKGRVSELEAKKNEFAADLKKYEENKKYSMAKIDEVMKKAEKLQIEVESLRAYKHDLEEQLLAANKGSEQMKCLIDENNRLQHELTLFVSTKNEKEGELEKKSRELAECVLQIESLKQSREGLNLRVKDLEMALEKKSREMSECAMQLENLKEDRDTLNQRAKDLETEIEKKSLETSESVMQIKSLKEGREGLNQRVKDLEMEIEKKSLEMSQNVMRIESLKELLQRKDVDEREVKDSLNLRVKDLEVETSSLSSAKSDLEEKLKSINDEAHQSKVEKEELYTRIFELEGKVREKDNGVFLLRKKVEVYENENKSFKQKLDALESEKRLTQLQIEKERHEHSHSITRLQELNDELMEKITEKDKILVEQEDVMKKLSHEHKQVQGNFLDSKLSLKVAERKMEEMAKEFRKKFEDNIRLLSRRIRVAEQLHAECKDWYKNTQEQFEQDQKTNREAFEKIKDLTKISNEMLVGLDTMGLKFAECCEHFMNRISKVSCELHFVKEWVARKNKAIKLVKEDFDCVLAQLDSKEEEILGLRQKVWKLENKVREFEKVAKENEEGMLVLKEEKREAIRQLCVWIDYHRGRCDYLKKTLTEVTSRNQTRSF